MSLGVGVECKYLLHAIELVGSKLRGELENAKRNVASVQTQKRLILPLYEQQTANISEVLVVIVQCCTLLRTCITESDRRTAGFLSFPLIPE